MSIPGEIKEMYQEALRVRENAYAPYTEFKVGACFRDENGRLHSGANIENGVCSASSCAEPVALYAALSKGHKKFRDLLVVGDIEGVIFPCGVCRQTMAEFLPMDFVIHCTNTEGEYLKTTLGELLPKAYTPDHLL